MAPRTLALLLVPFLVVACGSSGGSKPDGTGAAGTGAAGTDGGAGSGGHDAADAPLSDATDAPAGDAPASDATDAMSGPAPLMVSPAPGCGDAHIAVAGGIVYWTERATGRVRSTPHPSTGEAFTTYAMDQALPGPIAVDGTNLYWANEGDKTIMKVSLAGNATPTVLVTAPAVVGGLIASGGTVYYSAGASTFKIAGTGGAPTTLMTFAVCRDTEVHAIALDADHLYQTDQNNQYLTREKIDGTQANNNQCAADPTTAPKIMAPDVISHSQGELLFEALAVAGGEIVWADSSNLNAKAVTGTTATSGRGVASTLGANAVTGFVVAGANIYFGESGDPAGVDSGDAIEVAPFDPGEAGATDPRVVARGQRNATSFAADAGHIYWVTHTPAKAPGDGGADAAAPDDCAIMALAIGGAAP